MKHEWFKLFLQNILSGDIFLRPILCSDKIKLRLFNLTVLSRTLPRFEELDEDEQHLFRAAYDAPSYNQQEYGEEDLSIGKLDLVKDGLWMLKAKVKELKAFDKALAANMLATKLKLKELLKKQLVVAKKPHYEKPSYNYQAPSYQVSILYVFLSILFLYNYTL